MSPKPASLPQWQIVCGMLVAHRSTRQAAMNVVDKPWIAGRADVKNLRTGEIWERRGRFWTCVVPANSPLRGSGASPDGPRSQASRAKEHA